MAVHYRAAPGEAVAVRTVITSNKVGHDFPTGPLDIIQAWVELVVKDASGRVVYASGRRDERHFIEKGTFMFKAEPVDQYGNLIDRHNLWEMVGVRYRRSLFPGYSDTVEYQVAARRPGTLRVVANLAWIIGPTIGGYLTENWGWQYIFYLNLVPGLPMLALLWWALERQPMQLSADLAHIRPHPVQVTPAPFFADSPDRAPVAGALGRAKAFPI